MATKPYHSMPSATMGKFGNENTGLLTTVAELPLSFKLQYVSVETPLDLSVKTVLGQITPPHSPQRSPLKKRPYHHLIENDDPVDTKDSIVKIEPTTITAASSASSTFSSSSSVASDDEMMPAAKIAKKEVTPNGKQIKVNAMPKTQKSVSSNAKQNPATAPAPASAKEHKRVKAVRKLKFDEKKSSPVSGTIIRALDEIDSSEPLESGDIDPQYNIVEVTEEAKAEIAAIPNVIGSYLCKLCQIEFEDAFCLARHRCSCIVLLEYRCPECGKRFNCPANLASHRRWHKPKDEVMKKSNDSEAGENDENAVQYPCNLCGKFFKRQAYLRKHLVTHNKPNSKTNKRTVQMATETDNSSTQHENSTLSTLTTVAQTLLSQRFIDEDDDSAAVGAAIAAAAAAAAAELAPSTNDRSKSVCSDDSISSSQDSVASSIRFTFNIDPSSDDTKCNDNPTTGSRTVVPSPPPPFRLFNRSIFTEDENIAAAALAHLRHSKDSVIRHTTALST